MDYTLEGDEFFKKTTLQFKLLFIPFKANNFRPKFLQSKIVLCFVVCLFILKLFTSVISVNFPKNIFFADVTRTALMNFVNQSREAKGLEPLIENEKLDQAAMLKAQDMVKNSYFAHQSPQGITPWYWFLQSGYNYKYAGENLAIGFINSEEIFDAWYNSPSHKENMLNPNYKEFGTAILDGNFGGGETTVVVQLFGSPLVLAKQTQPKVQQQVEVQPQVQTQVQTPETAEQNTSINNQPVEVLSQTSEYPVLKAADKNTANTLYLQFLNFVFYRYDEILRTVVYGFLLLVAVAILLNIIIYFNIQHTDLIVRSVLILALLILTTVIDGNIVALIIL